MVIFIARFNPLAPPSTLNPREFIWRRKMARIRDYFKDKLISATEFQWKDTVSPFRLGLRINQTLKVSDLPALHTEIGMRFGLTPIEGAISLDYANGAMLFSFKPLA